MHYKKIVGKKVYLSPVAPEDVGKFTEWYNDPTMARGFGCFQDMYNDHIMSEMIEQFSKEDYVFSVVRLADDVLIGRIAIKRIHWKHRSGHYSILIGDIPDRGKGYGTEALQLLCDFAFNGLNLHTLTSRIYDFNISSLKSAQKVGFHICGTFHDAIFYAGRYHDANVVELIADEFRKKYDSVIPMPGLSSQSQDGSAKQADQIETKKIF